MQVSEIQEALREQHLDGWLFVDHHRRDSLAYRVLDLEPASAPTRRWFYLIPAEGEPKKLVHSIEAAVLDSLPGSKAIYSNWSALVDGLTRLVGGHRRLAMQYSPRCAVPYVSLVDGGTLELVRSLGVEVYSSADLIQLFEARWDQAKLETHLEAGRRVDAIRAEAFRLVGERTRAGTAVTEWEVMQFIRARFEAEGLVTDHGPIVGAQANAANPHYEPTENGSREISRGDVFLVDLWAKLKQPRSVYYDITWTGFCGPQAPPKVERVFQVVREARNRAIHRVQVAADKGEPLCGFEVDDAARGYIKQQGFGDYFPHRTGHSIGEDVHGAGANMDNLETHDERKVIPWTCFSIEPGIYLRDFGVRLEVNVFVGNKKAMVTGETQEDLVLV